MFARARAPRACVCTRVHKHPCSNPASVEQYSHAQLNHVANVQEYVAVVQRANVLIYLSDKRTPDKMKTRFNTVDIRAVIAEINAK